MLDVFINCIVSSLFNFYLGTSRFKRWDIAVLRWTWSTVDWKWISWPLKDSSIHCTMYFAYAVVHP